MGDPFVRPGPTYPPHIEHLVLKHPGTGTADTTPHEWISSQHRDTLSSIVLNHGHLMYCGCVENVSTARMRAQLLDKMIAPCGRPPKRARELPGGGDDEDFADEEDDVGELRVDAVGSHAGQNGRPAS